MKNKLLFFFFVSLLAVSCTETPPYIDFSEPIVLAKDTTYVISSIPAAQNKVVLIEDLSGVRCVNCPDAAVTAKSIQTQSPKQVVVVTLYPQSLKVYTTPFAGEDTLANEYAENIMTQILGAPTGLPSGAVDRKKYDSETSITISEKKWPKYANDQMALKARANLELDVKAIEATRTLVTNIKTTFTENINNAVFMTVMLIEDDIESKQDTRAGEVDNYIHHHVLRKCITPYNGLKLADNTEAGRVYEKGLEIVVPDKYNFKNCSVVVLINQNEPANKEIIQAGEAKP